MEAHYAKLSILGILLIFGIAGAPAIVGNYALEDSVQVPLRKRLCPQGLTSVVYQHGGYGSAGSLVIRCTSGPIVSATGHRFDTWQKDNRYRRFDRMSRNNLDNYRRHS